VSHENAEKKEHERHEGALPQAFQGLFFTLPLFLGRQKNEVQIQGGELNG